MALANECERIGTAALAGNNKVQYQLAMGPLNHIVVVGRELAWVEHGKFERDQRLAEWGTGDIEQELCTVFSAQVRHCVDVAQLEALRRRGCCAVFDVLAVQVYL